MKKKLFLCLILYINFLYPRKDEPEIAQWSILTYIQANNDLNWWAHYSFSHMISGMQRFKSVNVLAQWDHINSDVIRRCKIVPGDLEVESEFPKENIKNHVDGLVDAFAWMQKKYPAKNYALILWDHGTGILDYADYYKLPVAGRLSSFYSCKQNISKRAILFDDSKENFFTNQDLCEALSKIKSNLGRKIDIIVMDACFMQMLEVAYQIRDYAHYLVASQEYESGEGLPYGTFLYSLSLKSGLMNPLEFSKNIVDWYGLFYKNKEEQDFYTFSAIKLELMDAIKNNLDQLISDINQCSLYDEKLIYEIIVSSRENTHEFNWEHYIDLYSFYNELVKNIKIEIQTNDQLIHSDKLNESMKKLLKTAQTGKQIIKDSIIANVVGKTQNRAKGLSIYYPIEEGIYPSYFNTEFAIKSKWLDLIKNYK